MSLYGRADTKQGSTLNSLMPSLGMPTWLLAIAGYLALMTILNKVSEFIGWFEGDLLEAKYVGYFLGDATGLLSVVALLLFVFSRYTLCIYYLVVVAIAELALAIASIAGKTKDLDSYFYSLRGLDAVPSRVIGWTVGWTNISDNIQGVMQVAGPVASLAACTLLLYFHKKRPPNVQR